MIEDRQGYGIHFHGFQVSTDPVIQRGARMKDRIWF